MAQREEIIPHVYVVGLPGTTRVKIGKADSVKRRFRGLQTMSPVPVELLAQFPGSTELERALHKHLADYRQHGEWFDFPGQDPVSVVRRAIEEIGPVREKPRRARGYFDDVDAYHMQTSVLELGPMDDELTAARWAAETCLAFDPTASEEGVEGLNKVAEALVKNAITHGSAPVSLELTVGVAAHLSVADQGPDMPVARTDGTGGLAAVVEEIAGAWSVQENEVGKAVKASIPLGV